MINVNAPPRHHAAQDDPRIRALHEQAAAALGEKRWDEARSLLQQAHAINPDHPDILNSLGALLHRAGDVRGAEQLLLRSLKINPSLSAAHTNLGHLLRDTARAPAAEKAYRHALTLDPDDAAAMFGLAEICFAGKQVHGEAIGLMERCVALDPGNVEAWIQLSNMLESLSRLDEAVSRIEEAKRRFPPSPALLMTEARLLRRTGKIEEGIALLERHEKGLDADTPKLWRYYFELGQLHDRAGNADGAFRSFAKANALQAQGPKARAVDKTAAGRFLRRMRDHFTPELIARFHPPPPLDRKPPVFLIGFPRSGTTLLEQILSSHPGVIAANEVSAVSRMVVETIRRFDRDTPAGGLRPPADQVLNQPCFPDCLAALQDQDVAAMRRIYFGAHGMEGEAPSDKVFVDKNPMNLQHAGVIKRIFPDAKFIFALRHPCDAVLSFFMQEFAPNLYMARSMDLEDAARLYDEAMGLWQHYCDVLDLNVHTIRYEDVVADFRPAIAGLLGFLGLEWDDAVLEHDKTAKSKGRIGTPSYHQVTQKIYTRASGRWLRYRQHLEPVLPILAPHALKYGYAMEDDAVRAET